MPADGYHPFVVRDQDGSFGGGSILVSVFVADGELIVTHAARLRGKG